MAFSCSRVITVVERVLAAVTSERGTDVIALPVTSRGMFGSHELLHGRGSMVSGASVSGFKEEPLGSVRGWMTTPLHHSNPLPPPINIDMSK